VIFYLRYGWRCAQPRIHVVVAESLFKRRERWHSSAVAGATCATLNRVEEGARVATIFRPREDRTFASVQALSHPRK